MPASVIRPSKVGVAGAAGRKRAIRLIDIDCYHEKIAVAW
jgi:hypothetical protein